MPTARLLEFAMRAPQPVAVASSALRAAVVALFFAISACTSDPVGPTMPSGPSFAGTWVGTVTVAAIGGTLQLLLMPSVLPDGQGQYSGRWTIAFADSHDNTNGLASGRAIGTMVTLTLQPATPGACTFALAGTLDSAGTQINGSMSPVSCAGGTAAAPITLSKQ